MKKIIAFGELMLRLDTVSHERFVQADEFAARYTGAEANAAVTLANFGMKPYAVSKVPDNEIGQACINYLRRFGVDTDLVVRGGDRLGLLYLETGAGQRPSKVIYDRAHSSFSESLPEDYDWETILAGKDWFHFSGTAPALGSNMVRVLEDALPVANRLGIKVSVDLNYRSKLWSADDAKQVMTRLMQYVNVCIANEEHADIVLGVQGKTHSEIVDRMIERFGLDYAAITMREGSSASMNRWSASLGNGAGFCSSREYEVEIVDRIGAGDAFAGGLIYGILAGFDLQQTIDFAVAASCLKHSIPGDFNLVSLHEVNALLAGGASGRVQR